MTIAVFVPRQSVWKDLYASPEHLIPKKERWNSLVENKPVAYRYSAVAEAADSLAEVEHMLVAEEHIQAEVEHMPAGHKVGAAQLLLVLARDTSPAAQPEEQHQPQA